MDHRDKLLAIVQEKGPLWPSQINKELRTNVLFASAMLAEMVDQKKLKITAMKVGGSPLYYVAGQERDLEQFGSKLGAAEQNAFNILRSSKVLRDRDQEPTTRVALREIKDFAIPLEVTANGNSDLFWKYYLVADEDANSLIRAYIDRMLQPSAEKKEEPVPHPKKEVQARIGEIDSRKEEAGANAPVPVESHVPEQASELKSVKMTHLSESAVPEFSYKPAVSFSTMIDTDAEVSIGKEEEPEPEPEPEPESVAFPEGEEFFDRVKGFFDGSGIEIDSFEIIRKGTEYDFVVRLPSNVGILTYYCKAKSKAKLNDGDLSTAYVQGQIKKLPILFITVGDMTKRAEDLLSKEFRNMFVKRI
ncbi:hypothetical protein KY363_01505 [Candidatus Woesearchaeota archaeon]|nr:hypothetical protein [Candidatus Woesearchaeota archaeon]